MDIDALDQRFYDDVMTVRLMLSFSHSGATLLNQCLGCLPQVVILSELNPLGGGSGGRLKELRTVWDQAREWYQIELRSRNYVDAVVELEAICEERGQLLVIRDWTHVNFMPHSCNEGNPPQRLLNLEELRQHCDVSAFALVRDAIDVWLSAGTPDPKPFFSRYAAYAEAVTDARIPVVHYESFVSDPERVMREICAQLDLPFSREFRNFRRFTSVNGSIQNQTRGGRTKSISALPRRRVSQQVVDLVENCLEMKRANELFDYPSFYRARPVEPRLLWWRRTAHDYLRQVFLVWRRRVRVLLDRLSTRDGGG